MRGTCDPPPLEDICSAVELNNGVSMPLLGLGVYLTGAGGETVDAVRWALEEGYRLIDTASMYENEEEVGGAVLSSGMPREEVFVTTKLWNTDHGYERALEAFRASLRALRLDYVDLYLVHWPVRGLRLDSWRALEKLYREGLCRAIGVSNFTERHIDELLEVCEVPPAVNQVEFNPFLQQRPLMEHCHARGIRLEAYTPLARMTRADDPVLAEAARRHGKTLAQVMIRWCLQRGAVTIPKSSNRARIRENAAVFDFHLDREDMRALERLDEDYRVTWDPTDVP